MKVRFSCKSSFYLTCAKVSTDKWVDYVGDALFEGGRYRHVVLTVPEEYRRYFSDDPELLDELMRRGHTFYKDLLSEWLKEPIEAGSIVKTRFLKCRQERRLKERMSLSRR